MGTPALAVPSLDALRAEHEIVAIATQPDKPAGRKKEPQPSPVKVRALELNIPVLQPERARDESFIETLRQFSPEAIAVVAYGQILPLEILEMPRANHPNGGCVNLHFSLLPRWRGAAPVQYAIWRGDQKTGVSTQWMAEKLDAGDIILQREITIEPNETASELFERLTLPGAAVLLETLRLMEKGRAPRVPQNEAAATFAPTIKKEEGRIDWNKSATEIVNGVRALNSWPVAWCEWNGAPLKIWRASAVPSPTKQYSAGEIIECREEIIVTAGEDAVKLEEVQAPGRPRLQAMDWARGARLEKGGQLQ